MSTPTRSIPSTDSSGHAQEAREPLIKGSAPVDDVLKRIPVQRRGAALAERIAHGWPEPEPRFRFSLQEKTVLAAFTMLALTILWLGMPTLLRESVRAPVQLPESMSPREAEPLSTIPAARRPMPVPREMPAKTTVTLPAREAAIPVETPLAPENLQATFLAPRMIELRWDSLGTGAVYRVYASHSRTMERAWPLTENTLPATYMAWTPADGTETLWLAVQGMTPDGRATPLSVPLFVQFPL